jgi:hypothetical protein
MKKKERLKHLATKIFTLEKECQLGKDVEDNMDKMQNIMSTLSLEEMFYVIDYIEKHYKIFDN